jgi:Tetratricopeptide repeat
VAVRYLRRVIDVLPSDRLTSSTLVDLGMVEPASGEETALARFEQALTLIDEPAGHAQALYALGQTLFRRGRHEEALTTFRRGVELVADADPDMALLFEGALHCVRILVHSYTMESVSEAAAALRTRSPRLRAERVILAPLAMIRVLSDPPTVGAADLAYAALGNGALLIEQTSQGIAAILAIGALHWVGRASDAQHAAGALMADARDRGDAVAFAEGALVRAICLLDRGSGSQATCRRYVVIVSARPVARVRQRHRVRR